MVGLPDLRESISWGERLGDGARADHDLPLSSYIADSLSRRSGYPKERILIQENKDKYYDRTAPIAPSAKTNEVLHLMSAINRVGFEDESLCADAAGAGGFLATLARILDRLLERLRGESRPLYYLELGPEPQKTRFILQYLVDRGVRIDAYIGVDLNPSSKLVMREALASVLPTERLYARITDFAALDLSGQRSQNDLFLATSLGFQEGNETPAYLLDLYNRILQPGDLLLSEMQLKSSDHWRSVKSFYNHRCMRRFSRLAFEQVFPDRPSKTLLYILPMTAPLEGYHAAVLCEALEGGEDELALFVSNYCLKPSYELYWRDREAKGNMAVLSQLSTGDGSVAFQISARL